MDTRRYDAVDYDRDTTVANQALNMNRDLSDKKVAIPKELHSPKGLDKIEAQTLGSLLLYARETGSCTFFLLTLCDGAGLSFHRAQQALAKLQRAGFIVIEKKELDEYTVSVAPCFPAKVPQLGWTLEQWIAENLKKE